MPLSTVVNSVESLAAAQKWIAELWREKKWLKLSIHTGLRSLDANALSHVWYREIAEFEGLTIEEVHSQCKLLYGLPLLRADEDDQRVNQYFLAMGFDNWPYAAQLAAMRYNNITSLMDREQMTEYLDTIQREYDKQDLKLSSSREVGE